MRVYQSLQMVLKMGYDLAQRDREDREDREEGDEEVKGESGGRRQRDKDVADGIDEDDERNNVSSLFKKKLDVRLEDIYPQSDYDKYEGGGGGGGADFSHDNYSSASAVVYRSHDSVSHFELNICDYDDDDDNGGNDYFRNDRANDRSVSSNSMNHSGNRCPLRSPCRRPLNTPLTPRGPLGRPLSVPVAPADGPVGTRFDPRGDPIRISSDTPMRMGPSMRSSSDILRNMRDKRFKRAGGQNTDIPENPYTSQNAVVQPVPVATDDTGGRASGSDFRGEKAPTNRSYGSSDITPASHYYADREGSRNVEGGRTRSDSKCGSPESRSGSDDASPLPYLPHTEHRRNREEGGKSWYSNPNDNSPHIYRNNRPASPHFPDRYENGNNENVEPRRPSHAATHERNNASNSAEHFSSATHAHNPKVDPGTGSSRNSSDSRSRSSSLPGGSTGDDGPSHIRYASPSAGGPRKPLRTDSPHRPLRTDSPLIPHRRRGDTIGNLCALLSFLLSSFFNVFF